MQPDDLPERAAVHEAGHAVMAYRHGYEIRYGLTLDRLAYSCWYQALSYNRDDGAPVAAERLPCIVGRCSRIPNGTGCAAKYPLRYDAAGFNVGMLQELRHLRAIPNQDDRRREVERWICVGCGGDCAVRSFDPAADGGISDDLQQMLEAARIIYPEDSLAAEAMVDDLRTKKTYTQIIEPRKRALIVAIVAAVKDARHHTLPRDQLRAVIDATVASEVA